MGKSLLQKMQEEQSAIGYVAEAPTMQMALDFQESIADQDITMPEFGTRSAPGSTVVVEFRATADLEKLRNLASPISDSLAKSIHYKKK